MSIYSYQNYTPKLGEHCFIADGAKVIGKVFLGDDVGIWFNAVLRGDVGEIHLGDGTNIQDNSTIHITDGINLHIGKGVTVGHGVTLHSCQVEDFALIGMGATLLDNVVIGKESLVAAGSLCPPGKVYGERKLIRGNPAKEVRDLTDEEVEALHSSYHHYIDRKNEYLDPCNVKKV